MSFKTMVENDNAMVFLNTDEFAEIRTVKYDGKKYKDIPIVMSGPVETPRRKQMLGIKNRGGEQSTTGAVEGLYAVEMTVHCKLDDIGGIQPEKEQRFMISSREGGDFYDLYIVAESVVFHGMCRLGLQSVGE